MTTKNPISESRKAVAAEIAQSFYGVSSETISKIVNKFVRKAVKEQDMPYCTTIVETYVAGAERYRITIIGGYNEMILGGAEKTDRCFADVSISMMQNNRYDYTYAHNRVDERGLSVGAFAAHIIDAIYAAYLEQAEIQSSYNEYAESALREAEQDVMGEILAAAQDTFDNYVMDLQSIADNYGALETALDYYAAKQIAERIKDLGESLLSDLGDACGCTMCEEDGYWFDTAEFERWAGGYTFDHIDEIENLIDTLDYYITDAPLGLEQEDGEWVRDTEDTWRYEYPHYLWQDMKCFALTWMNYGPCTMPF